jgi:hypothetical protein
VLGDAIQGVPRCVPDEWTGPNRKTWFCFENDDDVRSLLGDGATPVAATIVVDRYRLIREFSDVFDMADLVGSGGAARSSRRCGSSGCGAASCSLHVRRAERPHGSGHRDARAPVPFARAMASLRVIHRNDW